MTNLVRQRQVDDLEYQQGREVDADESVFFSLDNRDYRLDLTTDNAERFRKVMQEYIEVATLVGKTKIQRTGTTHRARRDESQKMRVWAREHGFTVSGRGRLSAEVKKAYAQRNET